MRLLSLQAQRRACRSVAVHGTERRVAVSLETSLDQVVQGREAQRHATPRATAVLRTLGRCVRRALYPCSSQRALCPKTTSAASLCNVQCSALALSAQSHARAAPRRDNTCARRGRHFCFPRPVPGRSGCVSGIPDSRRDPAQLRGGSVRCGGRVHPVCAVCRVSARVNVCRDPEVRPDFVSSGTMLEIGPHHQTKHQLPVQPDENSCGSRGRFIAATGLWFQAPDTPFRRHTQKHSRCRQVFGPRERSPHLARSWRRPQDRIGFSSSRSPLQ